MQCDKCKKRYIALQKTCCLRMTENAPGGPPESDALNLLAQKYLNLWLEHWAAAMAAPETSAVLSRLFTTPGAAQGGGFDIFAG